MNLKDWPTDAIQIVCSPFGEHNEANMESVLQRECADCSAVIAVDSYTLRAASFLPSRHGRPIRFICESCFPSYDFDQVTEIHDHRHKEYRHER